jgi:hypothetical protein
MHERVNSCQNKRTINYLRKPDFSFKYLLECLIRKRAAPYNTKCEHGRMIARKYSEFLTCEIRNFEDQEYNLKDNLTKLNPKKN